MTPERKKILTAAIIVAVIIILLLLLRKKPPIGRIELPSINIQFPDYPTTEFPPIDVTKTTIINPPPGSCGCGGGGLLPDYQRLLDSYVNGLGSLIDAQYKALMDNLPGFYKQFVKTATEPVNYYVNAGNE